MAKSCIRALVVIFNVLFLVIGLAVLGLAIWLYFDQGAKIGLGEYKKSFNLLLYACMAVGGVTALIALCGCCGALFMSQCLLTVFFILLLIMFLAEVGSAVLFLVMRDPIKKEATKRFSDYVTRYNKGEKEKNALNPTEKESVDNIQMLLQCCGSKDWTDYGLKSPNSCCQTIADLQKKNKKDNVITKLVDDGKCQIIAKTRKGCVNALGDFLKKYGLYTFIAVLVLAAIEMFGMIFAMVLCCHVRRTVDEGYVGVST